jgi:adenine-specific DNA-methyltransferase
MPSLQFKGKVFVQNHHLVVPYHELTPVKAKGLSKAASLHDNLIIEGDNLAALKALLPAYHGKVKCIYIDPPYNTGNEKWVYNDNVSSPMMQDWLGKVVDREDLTRHDKWCCMMMPRLKLLRELLRDDGAIFVSIDDNEVHRLRCLMDEVFGEENFVATICWQKVYSPANDAKGIDAMHDFVVAYARSEKFAVNLLPRTEKQDQAYTNPDNDPRGPWKAVDATRSEHRDYAFYPIKTPAGNEVLPAQGRSWVFTKEELPRLMAENRLWFGQEGNSKPSKKLFLTDVKQGLVPVTWWTHEDAGHNDEAKKEVKEIISTGLPFGTPKPTRLLRRIFQIATDKDSIVLDSFAGSGTTAHAALTLNKEDGGNRRFILVETEDYVDSITAERVRRVIRGVPNARAETLREGLGGTFSYFKLGKALRLRAILEGSDLPDYESLASYVFFTATGEEFNAKKMKRGSWFIGESRLYDVFLMYEPNADKLKALALTLDVARDLPSVSGKQKLVFAPTKYLDPYFLESLRITFQQLPYQIYKALET